MTKIPVWQTAATAYRFAFRNYARLLIVAGVPAVLILIVTFWQMAPVIATMQPADTAHNPQLVFGNLGHIFLFEAAAFVLMVMMASGTVKLALARDIRSPLYYLAPNADFGRLLLACFLVLLILFGVIMVISIVLGIGLGMGAIALAGPHPSPEQIQQAVAKLTLLVAVPIYAVMLTIGIKFGFMLPAIVLSEKRLGIGRNWSLTRGNFWRIFTLVIVVLLPFLIMTAVVFALLAVLGGPSANILDSFGSQTAQLAWSKQAMVLYLKYWYVFVPIWLLSLPPFYGALFGVGAFAYRTVAESPPATMST